ncbi:polysaccharide deacetylase family protein [Desulfitobacterium sp.]|uniref:polysaccharide deacetylase family protein n=1 Tax=Desulfitobacterium sp. TaxID=49981 RepID=UPI002B1EAAD3|nr:polysaccharide deacetylase family protein [Desulfitobacterium sp.]MEA4901005.1 polysaccharide deacetylase family protein [Desulfitobacterium sp.]
MLRLKRIKKQTKLNHYPLLFLMLVLVLSLVGCSRGITSAYSPAEESGHQDEVISQDDPDQDQEEEKKIEMEKETSPSDEENQTADGENVPVRVTEGEPIAAASPVPDPPNTPVRSFYELAGSPPMAPGLAMRTRTFSNEPAKIVYLTFDDGPSANTPHILKILKDEGVQATFFVIGTQVEKFPDYLQQEYAEGNSIGNHTYSHNYADIYRGPQDFLASIKKNEDLIYRLTGVRPPIIRTPGGTQGHFNVKYYNAVDAAGYLVYDWNVSSGDAAAPLVPADQLLRNVQSQIPGKDRVILLMHDTPGKTTTVEALPSIIHYLKQEGFSFGVLKSDIAPILFRGGFTS